MKKKVIELENELFDKILDKSKKNERSVNKEIVVAIKNHVNKK